MESFVSTSEDVLINSLSFNPHKSGSFVIDSKAIKIPSESGNRFSAVSQRLIRFRLAGSWLDPDSLRFAFDLRNESTTTALSLLSPKAISIFNRARLIASSTVIEDVDLLSRTVTMLSKLIPPARLQNEMIMNGGGHNGNLTNPDGTLEPIAASDVRTMVVTLDMLGLFNQSKYIPVEMMAGGLVLELELNSDATYACSHNEWIVENPAILCDSKLLDSSLQEKYVSHLLSGKSLPITTKCLSCTMHTIVSTNQTIAIARGFSRLDAVFVSLYNSTQAGTKQINTYYHPMGNSSAITKTGDSVRLTVQLGSKKIPEYPISSLSEFYYRLQQAVGLSHGESMNIKSRVFYVNFLIMFVYMDKLKKYEVL